MNNQYRRDQLRIAERINIIASWVKRSIEPELLGICLKDLNLFGYRCYQGSDTKVHIWKGNRLMLTTLNYEKWLDWALNVDQSEIEDFRQLGIVIRQVDNVIFFG